MTIQYVTAMLHLAALHASNYITQSAPSRGSISAVAFETQLSDTDTEYGGVRVGQGYFWKPPPPFNLVFNRAPATATREQTSRVAIGSGSESKAE